ncbi:reverse transcriptase domain-containing protein [Tanacetum coccineum]
MYAQPNILVCPNLYPAGLFADPAGSMTPFVHWIEEYPLLDGLKMLSHVGSYDRKRDPNNFLHLFEGVIRMQKWLMPVACYMFTYTLKDFARIWWNSQKAGSILNYKDLKVKFRLHFSQQKRFTKTHLAVHNIKQEKARVSELSPPARNLVEHLSIDLPSTYKGLMEKTYTWIEEREVTTNGAPNERRDNFKSPRKSSWDNGIKKERTKTSDSQRGEKKEKSTTPAEAPILMINQEEITFPPVMKGSNSSAPVIIEAKIFRREVDRVHMDSGSSWEKSWAIEVVLLEITIGNAPVTRSITLNFIIVRSNSPYNMLLGRTAMQKIRMVVSKIHGAVKFHTTQGIRTVFSTYESNKIEGVKKVRETSPANTKGVLSCIDTKEKIIVNNKYPEQTVTIGKQLPEHFKERLQNLLRTNTDVFAWAHADMTGISRTITVNGKLFHTEHKLNEYSHIKPIKQKRRSLGPDCSTVARKEVAPKTVTLYQRSIGRRRSLLLLKHALRLKNARATYQRLVDKVFNDQIGRNLKAYVDDMVIKSISEEDMLADIKETFQRFQSINMKLNPKKCSFGVEEGPFLGHLSTKQGIRANPLKVKAITDIEQPKTLKDIQSLNGKLAALSRFSLKGAERS